MAVHALNWNEAPPAACRGGAVAIGNFDGAHRGHAVLVHHLRSKGRPAVVITFDPHPLTLLRPDSAPPLLTTPARRAELLHQLGADEVILLRTTRELLHLSAEAFFTGLIRDRLAAKAVVEGPNFRFGKDRLGDVEMLGELCRLAGLSLSVVDLQCLGDVEVSSTAIRAALLEGRLAEANAALGRRYNLEGVIESGQRRGTGLGFPTANLGQVVTVIPAEGVYAARMLGRAAAVNIGPNPTFGEGTKKIEAHVIGFQGDLYGHTVSLEFISRLRDTRRFLSVDDLKEQLRRDVERAAQEAQNG